jgi:hypothetical protein
MRQTKKNLLAVAGIMCTIIGVITIYPSILKETYWLVSICVALIIGGIILLAIAFGD